MIDVSALSVSIEVDMSAFTEAMEDVIAMMVVVAKTFEDATDNINISLGSINISGGETKGVFAQIIEYVLKAVEIFKALKDIIAGVVWVFELLGVVEEGATGATILGSFLALIGVSAELAPPIAAVLLVIAALALAFEALYDKSEDAKDSLKDFKKSAAELGQAKASESTEQVKLPKNLHPLYNTHTTNIDDNGFSREFRNLQFNSSKGNGSENVTPNTNPNSQQTESDQTTPVLPITPPDPKIDKIIEEWEEVRKKIHSKLQLGNATVKVEANAANLNTNDSDKKPAASDVAKVNEEYNKLGKNVKGVNDDIDKQNEKIKESAELQRDLQNAAVGSFTAIGDALGKMMAGQKNVNPLAAIIKQMADALKKYGEFLIAAGTAMVFGGDPAGAAKIGEGIALETVGTAMNSVKMASGGIVSGSTFANIGEYAGANRNPEVVAPLDKLRGMLGGGNVHHMEARISGDDLVFVTSRVSRFNQNSTGGGLGNY